MKLRLLLILPILLGGVSCQKPELLDSEPVVPVSVASVDEQNEISAALAEIQFLSEKLNLEKDFKSFPVAVVEQPPVGVKATALAFCQQRNDGVGVYIGILKSTMVEYLSRDKSSGENSFLYLLLIHELGHCLYQRAHDGTMLRIPGFNIFIKTGKGTEEYTELGGEIPVSAMTANAAARLGIYFLTESLKSYYLSEIAGIKRWKTREDLEAVEGLKLVHQ